MLRPHVGPLEDYRFEYEGLKFLLSHFSEPLWPRRISTILSENRRFPIWEGERHALAQFKLANLVDCRISAYPYFVEYKGVVRQTYDLLFIDLDKSHAIPFGGYTSQQILDVSLNATLQKMKQVLKDKDVFPTVLWSGNGYHIILPVQKLDIPFESDTMFCKFNQPSKEFLKFVSHLLTESRSDPSNKPTFLSCMLRVPFSFNSKKILQGCSKEDSLVTIKQKWNGYRPSIKPLLVSFYIHLDHLETQKIVQESAKPEAEEARRKSQRRYQKYQQWHNGGDGGSSKYKYNSNNDGVNCNNKTTTYGWIERILREGQQYYRRYTIEWILAPYLITVKRLSYEQSSSILHDWLYNKCATLRALEYHDNKYEDKINEALDRSVDKNWRPLSLSKLQEKKPKLYQMLLPMILDS